MHIAIVTGGDYGASGVFTHVRDLARQLAKRGIHVTVFSKDVKEGTETEPLHFVHIQDIRFVPQLVFYFGHLVAAHRRRRADRVYGVDSVAYVAAVLSAKLWRVPLVFNFQGSILSPQRELDYSSIQVWLFRVTNRLAAHASVRAIGVSQEMVRFSNQRGCN